MPTISLGFHFAYETAVMETVYGQHEFIEPEHFFIGVCKVGGLEKLIDWNRSELPAVVETSLRSEIAAIAAIFDRHDREALYREMRRRKGRGSYHRVDPVVHRSSESRAAFACAESIAEKCEAPFLDVTHLLAGLLEVEGGPVAAFLQEKGVELSDLRQATLNATIIPYDQEAVADGPSPEGMRAGGDVTLARKRPPHVPVLKDVDAPESYLREFGRDLTQLARDHKIFPPAERKREMLDVVRILSQLSKPCPILIGDDGVGKTSIVEGLACRIAAGNSPTVVRNKRIIQLDVARLAGGAKDRNDFEMRLRNFLREASSPEIILFIDDIHLALGIGAAATQTNATDILRSALARHEPGFIGAGSSLDFLKQSESDTALARRIQPIVVDEPSPEETMIMLQGVRDRLQEHHRLTILDEATESAIDLSVRHLRDQKLPGKAVDLLEAACAAAAVVWTSAIPGEEPANPTNAVGIGHVAAVVARRAGIPAEQLIQEVRNRST